MDITKIPAGDNPPTDINVVIEIPGGGDGGSPVKYEIDKDSGAVRVDRIVYTPMFYPCNYGFIPHTLHDDGDPTDVPVRTTGSLRPGAGLRCGPSGVLNMEDEGGIDDKILAVPSAKIDPFQRHLNDIDDLPEMERQRIQHFFERYKDLEADKWVKVTGWANRAAAEQLIQRAVAAVATK